MTNVRLPWGLKAGQIVHISDVPSGLDCGCVCPSCKARLVAKKGVKQEHHFAHEAAESCAGGLETVLHLAAKEILVAERKIWLPRVAVPLGPMTQPELLSDGRSFEIEAVVVEQRVEGIVPDLVLTIGGRELLVEVFVTHSVDNAKLEKISQLGLSAIEIDLSKLPREMHRAELASAVVGGRDNKRWLNNERVNAHRKRLEDLSVARRVINRNNKPRVERCPIKEAPRGGRYAKNVNFWGCFNNCPYMLGTEPDSLSTVEFVHCLGETPDAISQEVVRSADGQDGTPFSELIDDGRL
jgi:hypothetical protein